LRIEIDTWASQGREVHRAAQLLEEGGVLAIPTDSGYSLACDLHSRRAIDKIYALKQSPRSHPLSILLADIDHVGRYAGYISTLSYRTMKRLLPGPYTFIVEAGPEIPKRMHKKRRTVGIRVPDAAIPRALAAELGRPLVTTSIRQQEEDRFLVDPNDIDRRLGDQLAAVVDGGLGLERPTTVVDLTSTPYLILREGQGDIDVF
jgi:tRNA threonylcarbamoyl adenosine modification protein (Sua5/YciO/YrdC/YwlC family)